MKDFEKYFTLNPSIILVINSKTADIVWANESAIKFFKYENLLSIKISQINMIESTEMLKLVPDISKNSLKSFICDYKLGDGTIKKVNVLSSNLNTDNADLNLAIIQDITAESSLKETIKNSERKLKKAELIGNMGHWEFNITSQIIEFSDGAKSILGIDSYLNNLSELKQSLVPEIAEIITDIYQDVIQNRPLVKKEISLSKKKIYLSVTAIYDLHKEIIFGTVKDITTERKNIELATLNESRLTRMFSSLNIGFILTASDTTILQTNEKGSQLLGLDKNQLIGKSLRDLNFDAVSEDGYPLAIENYPISVASRQKQEVTNYVVGILNPVLKKRVWMSVNALPEMDSNQEVTNILCSFTDITVTKKQKEYAKKTELILNKLITIGHWEWDIENDQFIFSDEMYHILGISKYQTNTISLKTIVSRVHQEDKEQFQNHSIFLQLTGNSYPLDFRVIMEDGTIKQLHNDYIDIRFNELNKPTKIFGTTQDVTVKESYNNTNKAFTEEVTNNLELANDLLSQLLLKANNKHLEKSQKTIETTLELMTSEIKKLNAEINSLKKMI